MKPSTRILWLAILVVPTVALLSWLLRSGQYWNFRHRSGAYYAGVAIACDAMLDMFPLGTNAFREISPADPAVFGIIHDLHPSKIKISTNVVWILVDGSHSRDGLVITWEPQFGQTNLWNLVAGTGEGETEVVYVVKKH